MIATPRKYIRLFENGTKSRVLELISDLEAARKKGTELMRFGDSHGLIYV
jgi:hypothetical protein